MKQIVLDIGLAGEPTLANFFVGSNEAVLQHLRQCVEPQAGLSALPAVPTYLWGPSASGKTHLLKAVQQALAVQGAHVGWLDAAVPGAPDFDPAWQVVILDQVDLYSTEQQHTAFNWFVNAQTKPCWVLAAGEFPPADLVLREDLRTRLAWGQVFALQYLNEAGRRAVLQQSAQARGLVLGSEVMDFMLSRFSRDLGSLLQLLEQLDHYAMQTQRAITIPLIHAMLENS